MMNDGKMKRAMCTRSIVELGLPPGSLRHALNDAANPELRRPTTVEPRATADHGRNTAENYKTCDTYGNLSLEFLPPRGDLIEYYLQTFMSTFEGI